MIFLVACEPLYAQLEWSQKQIQLPYQQGAKVLQARFEFVNKGEKAVTIESVKTSCGCTQAGTAQRTYKPGEVGEVLVDFTLGDRVGHQHKTITVLTDDREDRVHRLGLSTYIPVVATIKPRMLLWKKSDSGEAKMIQILPEEGRVISGVKLIRPNENFDFEIAREEDQWRLMVRPKASSKVTTHGTVRVSVSLEGGGVKTHRVFLKRFI